MLRKKVSGLGASKCPGCGAVHGQAALEENLYICPECKRYLTMPSGARIALLADDATFRELDRELVSVDPLGFCGSEIVSRALARGAPRNRRSRGGDHGLLPHWRKSRRARGLRFCISGRHDGFRGGRKNCPRVRGSHATADCLGERGGQRRRSRARGHVVPHANGQSRRGGVRARSPGPCLYFHPDRPYIRRRHGQLCFAGRYHDRGAGRANRICGAARDRSRPPESRRRRIRTGRKLCFRPDSSIW